MELVKREIQIVKSKVQDNYYVYLVDKYKDKDKGEEEKETYLCCFNDEMVAKEFKRLADDYSMDIQK